MFVLVGFSDARRASLSTYLKLLRRFWQATRIYCSTPGSNVTVARTHAYINASNYFAVKCHSVDSGTALTETSWPLCNRIESGDDIIPLQYAKILRLFGAMPTFTAIDFETAQPARSSICQIGLVRVERGDVVEALSLLVQPPDNTYSYWNTNVHGMTEVDTYNAPFFNAVWPQIRGYIEGRTLVAHNGAFDFSCLRKTLDFYGMEVPIYEPQCTYKIYKKKLNILCEEYGIALDHHDALSDAKACAELYLRHLRG